MEVMAYDNKDEIIEELLDLLLSRYQIALEAQIRESDFIFDCVYSLFYKCHGISLKRGGSCIGSRDQMRKKIATIKTK